MNNNSLYECTIPPKNIKNQRIFYFIFKVLKIIFILFAILSAIYAFFVSNFVWLVVLFFFLIAFIIGLIQEKFYNFYDYFFCDEEIKFAKVINNKKRRLIIKFKVSDINKIGFVTSSDFNKYEFIENYKKVYAKSKLLDETNLYYAININGENKLIITSYHERFLSYILKKATNKILDGEFAETLKKYEKYNLS